MKNNFIKSSFILIIGGFFTKILGMLIKIIIARKIGSTGLGLYMLILPTFMLFINISQFGFPLSLSKLVSENTRNNKSLYISIIPTLFLLNIFLMISILILSPFISNYLLHNEKTTLAIASIAFVIPFTSISSICRSYFFGKNKMFPHILSNITEDCIRLLIIIISIDYIIPLGPTITISFLILINIFSELSSILILIFFLPKNISISKKDFIPNKIYLKDNLRISIPTTTNKIIGNIGYFLEPILLTTILLKTGFKKEYILKEYGIFSGYVIPLILLPSFFTYAISTALLPTISKEYQKKNNKKIKKAIFLALFLSLIISIPYILFLEIKPNFLLKLIYHTKEGIQYIRLFAPICILQYLEAPLSITLDAFGKSKENLKITIIGTIIRNISLIILSKLKLGIYSLIISISINIIVTTTYLIIKVKKSLS